jgi:8-oxo-dGTP diphosphatase
MDRAITEIYGNKIRLRVCGLCWKDGKLLMVNHRGLTERDFWAPPGGGLEFGEPARESLRREFLEETGLEVIAGTFRFGCEYIKNPLHSVELFFDVRIAGGTLKTGSDPEVQIIREVRFMEPAEIRAVNAPELHGIFQIATTAGEFDELTGFYRV